MKASSRHQNLFIRAHEAKHGGDYDWVGSGWEDTLTDLFGFLLSADDRARDSVIGGLLGDTAEQVMEIETQAQHVTGCPDLQITFASGNMLLLEHKVDASLGHKQFERYLAVETPSGEPAMVALISRRHLGVSDDVLRNDRYIRPTDGSHWHWEDVYRWIPEAQGNLGADWVRQCFREYLRRLGFAPPDLSGMWKELLSWGPESNEARDEFGRRIEPIRKALRTRGFEISGDSRSGVNAKPPEPDSPYLHLTVGPARGHLGEMNSDESGQTTTAVFRVALVYDSAEAPQDAIDRFNGIDREVRDANGFAWYPVFPYRMSNPRTRLSIVSRLDQFLKDNMEIDRRLKLGFEAAFEALLDRPLAG